MNIKSRLDCIRANTSAFKVEQKNTLISNQQVIYLDSNLEPNSNINLADVMACDTEKLNSKINLERSLFMINNK